MKIIFRFTLIFALVVFTSSAVMAQKKASKKIETTEVGVVGVCKMCKERIENAALVKGVKVAEWSKETQKLKVIFDNRKTNIDKIHAAIAEHGHDTDKVKAKNEAYQKLPKCCAYRDGVKVH